VRHFCAEWKKTTHKKQSNKKLKMRIIILFILLFMTFGCATRQIKYDQNKIAKKYAVNYQTYLDNVKVNLTNIYLDKKNIKNVRLDIKTKDLYITQLKPTELFELKNINLDSLSLWRRGWDKKKIDIIIFNGIVVTDSLKDKIKFDPNALKSFEIVSEEKINNMTFCRRIQGDLLIITTK